MTRKIVRFVAIVLGPPSLYVLARSVWFWPIEAFDAYAVFRSGLIAPILGLLWVEAAVAVLWWGGAHGSSR